MDKDALIYVAGHTGLAGSAILRKLKKEGYDNLLLKSSGEVDLRNQNQVKKLFEKNEPEYVFLAAAKVGGIWANKTYPAEFIYDNIMIQTNVIHEAYKNNVIKLCFLGSSCVYPKYPDIPITEDQLLTGPLESTNEAYAVAKISGLKMVEFYNKQYGTDFISIMPTNLYGPNDNYHPKNSHVLAALVRKFVEAKRQNKNEVILWGSGKPKREFLYSDDFADACIFLMKSYSSSIMINVGTGKDISINDLADKIAKITEFNGSIEHDLSKPDGTPRKVMNVEKLFSMGWRPKISLNKGLELIVSEYKSIN